MNTNYKQIGIIGCGNMGSAIAERLKDIYEIFIFDKDATKLKDIQRSNICGDAEELAAKAGVIVLAVKPQDFDALLEKIKGGFRDKLVISIAAGISTRYIEKKLGKMRVVRVMPNLPAKIGRGMSCISRGAFAGDEDLEFARTLFERLGKTMVIKEKLMDAATAVVGSGPGFLYHYLENIQDGQIADNFISNIFIPSLIQSAEELGFSAEEARLLVTITTQGAMAFLKESGQTAAELSRRVASKGGTTEAGLKVLREGGTLQEAVKAAKQRAQGLSNSTSPSHR